MHPIEAEPGIPGLEVAISKLLVATSDGADIPLDVAMPRVLRLFRERLKMDVVFVSEFANGQRVFRHVDLAPGVDVIKAGGADPLEASWCQRVADGRLPRLIVDGAPLQAAGLAPATAFPIGTHLSVPLVLSDGRVYGTLCCFSFSVSDYARELDLEALQFGAGMLAKRIEVLER